jgi:hypothetical protein
LFKYRFRRFYIFIQKILKPQIPKAGDFKITKITCHKPDIHNPKSTPSGFFYLKKELMESYQQWICRYLPSFNQDSHHYTGEYRAGA